MSSVKQQSEAIVNNPTMQKALVFCCVIGAMFISVSTADAFEAAFMSKPSAQQSGYLQPVRLIGTMMVSTAGRLDYPAPLQILLREIEVAAESGFYEEIPGLIDTFMESSQVSGQQLIVPECIFEWLAILRSLWDLGIGLLLSEPEANPECFALTTSEDMLFILESMMAYRICSMRYSENPDEDLLHQMEILRKVVLVIDEFLYIIELLACHQQQ